MAVKGMTELDAIEASALRDSISRVQNALFYGGLDGEALALMRRFLDNARSRLDQIEVKATEGHKEAEDEERSAELVRDIAVAKMVARETALNSEEKAEFGVLLRHEFFTKAMFGQLEHFYAHSYDKLTEGGKAEMSHRVWEGVRHGEYRFQELPNVVKEKEAARLYDSLRDPRRTSPELLAIPVEERSAFLDAWANKDCRKAYEILDHPAFARHVALTDSQATIAQQVEVKSASAVIAAAGREAGKPDFKPVAADAIGSKKISLEDAPGIDDVAGILPPPLSDRSGFAGVKGRQ